MGDKPFIKFYPSDFLAGTSGLSPAERGVYITLLCLIYENDGPISNDTARLSRRCGVPAGTFRRILSALIDVGKVAESDDMLSNRRAERSITDRSDRVNSAKVAAQSRWSKETGKREQNQTGNDAGAMRSDMRAQCASDAIPEPEPERDTNVSLRSAKPDPYGFDEFWSEVPRKAGKGAARKAYAQAAKKADPQTIIAGMQRYAQERQGKDEKYTAHPATWLNAERWTDAPPRAGAADFHDQLKQALGGDDGLPRAIAHDHRQAEHVSARIPAPGASDDGTRVAGDTQVSRRGEQAYRRLNRG